MRAPAPAPASTTTSTPVRPSRWTTSGTMATRFSPEAVSLGTPSFIESEQGNGIDWSVGLSSLLSLPVQLSADAKRPKDRVAFVGAPRAATRERQPCRRPHRGGDQEEERDRRERREQDGPPAVAARAFAAHAAEAGHPRPAPP